MINFIKSFTLLLILTFPLHRPVSAQGMGDYEIDWDLVEQIAEESHALAADLVNRFELPVTLPPVEQLGPAMRLIVQTLEQGSVEDLARLAPFAHLAYDQLAREPRFAPYVHWLSQRLDYFDVAQESISPPAPSPAQPSSTSARAAAQYLRYLYGRFDDWSLALAAYNGGEGRLAGLIRTHGRSFDTLAPHLPAETRMYVPKVLATVSERENIDARTLPPPTAKN